METAIVIHGLQENARPTNIQNVLAMANNRSVARVIYVNALGIIPKEVEASILLLTYDFLALRNFPIWNILVSRLRHLILSSRVRVAMPQDDYSLCAILDDFFCDLGITDVYTPITRDLEVLYPKSLKRGIRFSEALTGYIDTKTYKRVSSFSKPFEERTIDVGQRVRLLPPSLGEKAERKGRMAVEFGTYAESAGFKCSISTRPEDVLLGDGWYQFLGNCRFTIGRKGGASLADPWGNLADRVRRYQVLRPHASSDLVVSKVSLIGGRPGDFSAVSPRVFEASALGVCQILELDEYFEGFEPWIHYLPIEENRLLDPKVFAAMRDYDRCIEVVENAHSYLVASSRFTYQQFIINMFRDCGMEVADSLPEVVDSSSHLDPVVQSPEAIIWVQGYLARAIAGGKLRQVERSLRSSTLLLLCDEDLSWTTHAATYRESLLAWIESFYRGELLVESLAIPWRSAASYLDR